MSAHDAEDLLAILNATEFYVRTQAALYLGFGGTLRVEEQALGLTRGLLQAVGVRSPAQVAPAAPAPVAPAPAGPAPGPTDSDTPVAPPRTVAPAATPVAAVSLAPVARVVDSSDEDVGDPPTFGEPEETEDLLRDHGAPARTVGEAMAFGLGSTTDAVGVSDGDTEVEEELELEIEDPGQDALVTIEDTSDPRSDLDGLSRLGDSDLDDEDEDSVDDEIIVRKDDGIETFDLMPDLPLSDMSPDEEETFVADLADIERMKAKMEASAAEDTSDGPSEHEVVLGRSGESGPRARPPTPMVRPATPRPVAPRVVAGAAARAGTPAGAAARAGTPVGAAARAGTPVGAAARAGTPVGAAARAGVTAGLYGNPAVPTIRDRNEPRPRAAALQIDAAQEQAAKQSSGASSLLDEDEVLELGSSEDYGEEEVESTGGGLSLDVQEYEEELEEVELEDDDIELEELDDDVPLAPVDDSLSAAELDAMLHRAVQAVEGGDMESAIDFYSDVIDADPDNADARVKRGRLYLDYGDYSRAMSDFMMAEDLAPDSPEPQIAVGDLYFARKDYTRAIECFNEALKMSPNHAMAYCRRGISHYYRKNYPQALEDLNRAEKIDADIPNIRTYVAMAKKKVRK